MNSTPKDIRTIIDILEDIATEPEIGDIIEMEFGDLLVETSIEDITEDGVVIKLDETALRMIIDARKQFMVESKMRGDEFEKRADELHEKIKAARESGNKSLEEKLQKQYDALYDDAKKGLIAEDTDSDPVVNAITRRIITQKQNIISKYGLDNVVDAVHAVADTVGRAYEIGSSDVSAWVKQVEAILADQLAQGTMREDATDISEAEYQGRKVPLGKPMKGDVKKSKVYVKNAKGNVVKVNFGDKKMRIKKSNPARRKSFRARHNCENPGPRWKAKYWSCRAW